MYELPKSRKMLGKDAKGTDRCLRHFRKEKTASYAKDMCTMMYMAVNSYQLLKMGLIGKGEELAETHGGSAMTKIKGALDIGTSIPAIGKLSRLLSKIVGFFIGLKEDAAVDKIY